MRKISFLAIFLAGFIFMSGCATIEGLGKGLAEGLAEDSKVVWRSLVKADEWVDEHAW